MVKKKEFHFTFKVFLRLLIFFVIIYLSISYLSSSKVEEPVLGDTTTLIEEESSTIFSNLYQQLPESSRHQLENFQDTQLVKYIQEKTEFIQEQSNGFPDRQIKEFQKSLIKKVSQDMIDNIDNSESDENN